MVYSVASFRQSGSFIACSVAPPAHPDLPDRVLKELSIAHFHIDDRERMAGYVAAIRDADDATIELARMQLLHVTKEVKDRLGSMLFRHPLSVDGPDAIGPAIRQAVEGIALDVGSLLEKADRTPRATTTLKLLAGALQTLAEASLFANRLRDAADDPDVDALAADAAGRLEWALDLSDRFREAVGVRYGEVAELLPESETIRDAAARRFSDQATLDGAVLTPDHLYRTQGACGERGALWVASQAGHREDAIATGRHRPLTSGEAEGLRASVASIVETYDAVFNQPGFLALVRQGAVLSRWNGLNGIHDAHDGSIESDIREAHRRSRNSLNPGRPEDLARSLAELPADRERWRRTGRAALAAGLHLGRIADAAAAGIGGPSRPVLVLRTDIDTGAVVGSLSEGHEASAVVIYPDRNLRRHPGAVLAVVLPADLVAGGVPDIESVREEALHGSLRGSNFAGLEQAVACLAGGDEYSQSLIFGRSVTVVDETDLPWTPPHTPGTVFSPRP
jgi:hypothetical protein